MFAVVKIAGFQEKVEEGMKLSVPALNAEPGSSVTFTDVLLLSKGEGNLQIGKPTVGGASVVAKVIANEKGEKIRVFKMHRRKRYRRTHGHRTHLTEIEVTKIVG